MPAKSINESTVEATVLSILESLGYEILHGPDIAPGELQAERDRYDEVVLRGRLRGALLRLNPALSADSIDEVVRKIIALDSPTLIEANRRFHGYLVNGIGVEVLRDGHVAGETVALVDFVHPEHNEWLVVNQFTIIENGHQRRPDVIIFINGIPLATFELKNPADANVDIRHAFNQLQTYKSDIPTLFHYNEALVSTDGLHARAGTLTSDWGRFQPWRTIDGGSIAPTSIPQLEVMLRGVFAPARFLELLRDFIVFSDDGEKVNKIMAAYHQYHAVKKAVECTLAATAPGGDRRIGVVWHTQGSGKSLSMAFYAGKIIRHQGMKNPTLVIITDRNDLDEQLFGTFCQCKEILRQTPVQADSRTHLRELLKVSSGGVVFTTIQKFAPDERGDVHSQLSNRRNIVVIADEAHRSQYGFSGHVNEKSGEMSYGFAKYLRDALPNASFIGFTGTPVELDDRSTPAVFGEYIDKYDIHRAVEDGATVPIYYEARLAQLALQENALLTIDADFDEVTEGEETSAKEKMKSKWASLEAMVGNEDRLRKVAEDLVKHFEARLDAMEGKAMVVCMSRRICVALYKEIIRLRPEWHGDDDATGAVKIVMTGSAADVAAMQPHIRTKQQREALARRFKTPTDPFKLVIVRDMWLTGFDAPCLHTMYLDKPMHGHGLMQAIARVNRVFKDKPGGLVVDYLGLADQLKRALLDYTASGGQGRPTLEIAAVVPVLQEKYEIVAAMFHGFDFSNFMTGTPHQRLALLPPAQEHILAQVDGAKRYTTAVGELSKAFALIAAHPAALAIRDEVAFFQAVRVALVKTTTEVSECTKEDMEGAIRQIVARAVATEGVISVFDAAGLPNPGISILSDEFLDDVKNIRQRNLAVELLRKLITDGIKSCFGRNVVQGRSFAKLLEQTVRQYKNRAIETAQVIEELIALAKNVSAASHRGDALGLSEDEIAFYDALSENGSAKELLGDEQLRFLAQELVQRVRQSVTIDWASKESARAKLRLLVKNILRKYGYPPDMAKVATELVLDQTEVLCQAWVG